MILKESSNKKVIKKLFAALLLLILTILCIGLFLPAKSKICGEICVQVSHPRIVTGTHAYVRIEISNTTNHSIISGIDGCSFSNRTYTVYRISDNYKMPSIPREYGCFETLGNQRVEAHNTIKYEGTIVVGHLPSGHYRALLKFPDRNQFSDESWYKTTDFNKKQLLSEVSIVFWKL